MNQLKVVLAVALIIAGMSGFYLLPNLPPVVRLLFILAGLGAAVAVMLTTATGQGAYEFLKEAIAEARKVVWPSRKETIQTTGIVFALVVVMAIILWIVDASLLWALKFIMGRGE
jgi:preprotein translocase subunit SecE